MNGFETKQYLPESNTDNPDEIKIEIPEQEWQILQIIAKRVGGDFGMTVKLGEPGEGSFFNSKDCSITLDPLHIKENSRMAKFVAGHEGSHRAITPNPKELGLSSQQIEENYSQIGFGYLQNVIEDPAVNDWMVGRFPGLREYVKECYDGQFKEEDAVLSTPEVKRIAARLGYWPKFAQYGSEIIRDWHQGRFSQKLDPAVEKALKRTVDDARKSRTTIPTSDIRDQREIISTAQERFRINTEYIWPEMKKLVEMDLHTEEQRQMIEEFRQKQKELEQKEKELQEAQAQGDSQRAKELQEEIDKLKQELNPFDGLPEDVKKELQEKIDKAIREAIEKLNKEIEEKQKQIQEAKKRQEELDAEIKELEKKLKDVSGREKEELEKQIQEKRAEKLKQEIKQKQAEQELKKIQDTLEDIQSGEEMPYPEDELSKETKQELEKLFRKLPNKKQKSLHERAERQLEDFEDTINSGMEGQLNEDKPESHSKRREREEEERRINEERQTSEEDRIRLQSELEKIRQERMTEYDKAYEEVADVINLLYNRLKRFFLPERHPRWRKDYPTGSRLNLEEAMQAEADPRHLDRIWERKTIPRRFDYRFIILVDISGSMIGEKIEETFKGVVVFAEVLERLGIQYEIIGFSDTSEIIKAWGEKLDKKSRDNLSLMKSSGGGGTETTGATQRAYRELLKNLGHDNFLITLTDGEPDNSESLTRTLEEIAKEKKVKLVGIGLGPGTEFVREFYKAAFSLPKMKITEQERRQGQKDFVEALAELLEDMIRYPEKY